MADTGFLDGIYHEMVCNIEDALDMAGAGDWEALARRGEALGWTRDDGGWMVGRHFHVLFELQGGAYEIVEMYLPRGVVTCSLSEPLISVCNGPPIIPFPEEDEVLHEFDTFYETSGCRATDKTYVLAAYRVLCRWYEFEILTSCNS